METVASTSASDRAAVDATRAGGRSRRLRSDLLVGICMARPRPARANGRSGRDHHGALHERMNGTVVGVGTEAGEDVAVGAVLSQGA